jgi:hypothetical protein
MSALGQEQTSFGKHQCPVYPSKDSVQHLRDVRFVPTTEVGNRMSGWIAPLPHGTLGQGGVQFCCPSSRLLSLSLPSVSPRLTELTHSGAECYLHGRRMYVPDGLNYPRQAWAGWGITCRTATPEIAAGSGATGSESGERPVDWCGWWMRQHLGGRYGPEFNVARNWLNAGRPLDGPRPGAIGVKAHHVFQVIRVVDRDHVLAISGNDHNDVRTRIRPTSDVIGWRDVTEESTAADKPAADTALTNKTATDKIGPDKSADDASAQGP